MTIFEIETFTQRTGCLSFKIETTSVADPGLQIRWRPQFGLKIRWGGGVGGGSATANYSFSKLP